LNDLNDGLAYALEARDFENFQGMVNKSLVLENHRRVMQRKHKLVDQDQPGSTSRTHTATPIVGPVFHPAQPQPQQRSQSTGQGFSTPLRQVIQRPINFPAPAAGSQNVHRTQVIHDSSLADHRCSN
jgi:hypothetical protein